MQLLPIKTVLDIVTEKSLDLKWRYLEHLILSDITQDRDIHTDYASVLIDSICSAQPEDEDMFPSPDDGNSFGPEVIYSIA